MDKEWKPQHKPFLGTKRAPEVSVKPSKNAAPAETDEDIFDDSKPSRLTPGSKPDDGESSIRPWMWKLGVGVIIGILVLAFLIIPAARYYDINKAMKASGVPKEYVTNMGALQAEKDTALQDLSTANNKVAACAEDVSALQQALEKSQAEAAMYSTAADNLQAERDEAQDALKGKDATIENAAKRLCCIARIENSAINAYAVVDDKIVCVSEGGEAITC